MDKEMTFEQANNKLAETVKKMEDQSLTLQESVDLYAQACELLAYCVRELDAYKGQITEIHDRMIKNKKDKIDEN